MTSLHPQSAPSHYIEAIWIKDQYGNVVFFADMLSESSPQVSFTVPAGATKLTPYEYCNLHGLWQGPTYDVAVGNIINVLDAAASGPSSRHLAGIVPIKHDPFIEFDAGGSTGVVGVRGTDGSMTSLHPQSAPSHYIEAIWIKDQDGNVVFFADMLSESSPQVSFTVPAGATKLTPYEYCNLHGLWQGPTYDVAVGNIINVLDAAASGPSSRHLAGIVPIKHDPFIEFDAGGSTGVVGVRGTDGSMTSLHPQSAPSHYIEAIWIKDQDGNVVFFADMLSESSPQVSFTVPVGATKLTPYEYCNLHGLWQGPTYDVAVGNIINVLDAAASGPSSRHLAGIVPIKHDPFIEFDAGGSTGVVGVRGTDGSMTSLHPQSAPSHYIEAIWIKDQYDNVVFFADMLSESSPQVSFTVPVGATKLTPYEYCNLHGLWQGPTYDVAVGNIINVLDAAASGPSSRHLAGIVPIKHDPFIEFDAGGSTGVVGVRGTDGSMTSLHPQSAPSHYIEAIWIKDQDGNVVFFADMLSESSPQVSFTVPVGATKLTPYEYCNLHGLWQGPTYDVAVGNIINVLDAATSGPSSRHLAGIVPIKHDPFIEFDAGGSTGVVGVRGTDGSMTSLHPQSAPSHYIEAIWIKDQYDNVVFFADMLSESSPQVSFTVPVGATKLTPYEYCNLHGLWQGPTYDVAVGNIINVLDAAASGPSSRHLAGIVPIKHDPFIEFDAGGSTGVVGVRGTDGSMTSLHPQSAPSHYIEAIWIKDQYDNVVFFADMLSESSPQVSFTVPAGATKLTPYEYCNLHGLWQGPTYDVAVGNIINVLDAAASGPSSRHLAGIVPIKHDPFIEFDAGGSTGVVGVRGTDGSMTSLHPQSAPSHYIEAIWIKDQYDNVVFFADMLSESSPQVSFTVPAGATKLTPYEYCNLHGLWQGPTYDVAVGNIINVLDAAASGPSSRHLAGIVPIKHDPFIEFDAGGSTGVVGVRGTGGSMTSLHPQSAPSHYIEAIWIKDQYDNVVFFADMLSESSPQVSFTVPVGATKLTPYEYCNLHGLWQGPTYNVYYEQIVSGIEGSLDLTLSSGPLSYHEAVEGAPVKHDPFMVLSDDIESPEVSTLLLLLLLIFFSAAARVLRLLLLLLVLHAYTVVKVQVAVRGTDGSTTVLHPQDPSHFIATLFIKVE